MKMGAWVIKTGKLARVKKSLGGGIFLDKTVGRDRNEGRPTSPCEGAIGKIILLLDQLRVDARRIVACLMKLLMGSSEYYFGLINQMNEGEGAYSNDPGPNP